MFSGYQDSVEQAGNVARQAIPLAVKHSLPINPIIYAVIYQHIAKINQRLTHAFESLLSSGELNKETVERLYHNYIYIDDMQALESLRIALDNLILSTRGNLESASNSSANYESQLGEASRELNRVQAPESIKSIINTLVVETEKMRTTTQHLRSELNEANTKIDDLHAQFTRLRHESLTDPLTGLHNRRAFDQIFYELCHTEAQEKSPLCLLVIDIDHFKKINDNYGHALGDAVLKWVGKILSESVRGNDVVARIGGEEFVILLPETNLKGAGCVAENIRNNISKRTLKYGENIIGQTTVSIGVSMYDNPVDKDQLFEKADNALYEAKRQGRNRVVIYQEDGMAV